MTNEEIGALLRIERTARALIRAMGTKVQGATRQVGELSRAITKIDKLRGSSRRLRVSPRDDRG